MTYRKYVAGKATYTFDMYLNGVSFEEFCESAKKKLMCDLVNFAELNEFSGQFTIQELDHFEVWEQVIKKERADGQFVLKGEFAPREVIEDLAKQHCRTICLDGYVTHKAEPKIFCFETKEFKEVKFNDR